MTIAHVQSGGASGGGSSSIVVSPLGSNVASGNVVLVSIGWNSSTITLTSITSNRTTGNWTLLHNPTLLSGNGYRHALSYAVVTGSGAMTVTATLSGSPSLVSLLASEYSGVDTTTPVEDSDLVARVSQGTGTDAFATDTVTCATNNALVWGVGHELNLNDALTTGTGYTGRVTAMTSAVRGEIEDKAVAVAGNTTATFTSSVSFYEYAIGAVCLKAAGASFQAAWARGANEVLQ